MSESDEPHVPLGTSGWLTWPICEVRGAGFPVDTVRALADPSAAEAADSEMATGDFDRVYAKAEERSSAVVREFAAHPLLREAVAWQNPNVLRRCLDKLVAGTRSKPAERRRRELTTVSYLQRYATKNDTVGFFGPVAWARWRADGDAVVSRPGPSLTARRTVYFESWAIDAVADAFAADPEVLPWLVPRLAEPLSATDDGLRTARGRVVRLQEPARAVVAACDGVRTCAEVSALLDDRPPGDVLATLLDLRDRDLLRVGFDIAVGARPEVELRAQLDLIGDARLRDRLIAALDDLVEAKDRVAASAGDDEAVAAALERLDERFEELTGTAAQRRPGESYAGRTVVYEDTTRDLRVDFGPALMRELAPPLTLLLDAASWLAGRAGERYERLFTELYRRAVRDQGDADVPLATIVAAATPSLAYTSHELPPILDDLRAELHRRWAEVLAVPEGVTRHHVASRDIADRVRAAFPKPAARWTSAARHSPDVMIAASSAEAVHRGEFTFVLGELHVAANTLESRVFVAQHDQPDALLRADERDHAAGRFMLVPTKDSASVNSRTYPSALQSPMYTYWCTHSRTTGAPGPVLPASRLVVREVDGKLVVRTRDGALEVDVVRFLGEQISSAIANAFGVSPPSAHRPRVTIDRLVVAREAWRFTPTRLGWAFAKSDSERFRAARRWRADRGLPERAFYRVPNEDKPVFVDFTSPALVALLAKFVRRCADHGGTVAFTEMLPDLGDCWLTDADGARYTSELRLVAVDPLSGW